MVGPPGVHIKGEQALAGGDEKAVSFGAAKAEVTGGFGEFDVADAKAFGVEDVNTVVLHSAPSCTGPDIAFDVAADAIGAALDGEIVGGDWGSFQNRGVLF